MLSFPECGVRVFVLFIYTIDISILCALREELSLTESNQQFYLWLFGLSNFFKTKDIVELCKVNLLDQWIIHSI